MDNRINGRTRNYLSSENLTKCQQYGPKFFSKPITKKLFHHISCHWSLSIPP